MTHTLWPHQQEARAAAIDHLGRGNTLLVMATGTGKTHVFCHVAQHFALHGKVLILAHREELITQAADRLAAITGVTPEIEMAEWHAAGDSHFVVSSVQTMVKRLQKHSPTGYSLIIVDEAHHSLARTYRKILAYFDAPVLGVTATPDRGDKLAMGEVFDSVCYEYDILTAIHDGYLVPIRSHIKKLVGLDFSKIKTVAGDLNQGELAEEMERDKPLLGVSDEVYRISGTRRKTLVFATSVHHAQLLCDIFNRHRDGIARFICGKTPKNDRRQALVDFRNDEFNILVNVGVYTEGFDEPSIEVVAIARPTKSRSLYCQMIGRGTRIFHGKDHLLVLNFAGNHGRHRLITPLDVLGGKHSQEVVDMAAKRQKPGVTEDPEALLERMQQEVAARDAKILKEEERKRRAFMIARATYETQEVDPFAALGIRKPPEDDGDFTRRVPASKKQIAFLAKNKIDAKGMTKQEAQKLVGTIMVRRNSGNTVPTLNQGKILLRYSYDPADYNFKTASEKIDAIACNGWERPDPIVQKQGDLW